MSALDGVKVLDFGRFIAGPYCAALLADFGADVIRIDRVGGSEDRFISSVGENGEGAFFLQCNRNKRSLTLELDRPEAREILHRLVRGADVVVANMPLRTIASLGLDYESLRAIKPDIIVTASTAFGTEPAVRDRTGFDGVGQAISGAVHMAGLPGHPTKAMVPVVDFATGLSCALGTVMALFERQRSGLGQEVGASLLHTGLNLASGTLIEESVLRLNRSATGNRSPNYGPSDIFRVKDGWIIVQVIGRRMFKRWATLVGRLELLDDPRFQNDRLRGENGESLSEIMSQWCAQWTRAQALERLEKLQIPAGPVNSPRQALDDENIQAAGAFSWVEYPGVAGMVPIISPPVSLSRTASALSRRPPLAGEHTDEILQSVGYSSVEVSALRERGIV